MESKVNKKYSNRYFGNFGGQFVPEILLPPLIELEEGMEKYLDDDEFKKEYSYLLKNFVGRPSPLYKCPNLSKDLGISLYLKREDLNHTGAHKVNNTLGQCLLAKKMGKNEIIAETGAGQHGVATAAVAASLNMECVVYMGSEDVERQSLNVKRMELFGARVESVSKGTKTLKDAINAALRKWISDQETTHYCIGSVVGPHPFPLLVRYFQGIISFEAKKQFRDITGKELPDYVVACVGGGSNAMGMFHNFVKNDSVKLIGVEAAGEGTVGCYHSLSINEGEKGVLHGAKTYILEDADGQILPSHSLAPGLDYPGVGPEHSYLKDIHRAQYHPINDKDAFDALVTLSRKEGIIPALESAHAIAWVIKNKDKLQGCNVIVCLSGRGDKDMDIVSQKIEEV